MKVTSVVLSWFISAALALGPASRPGRAPDVDPLARAWVERGLDAYRQERYRAARSALRRAYAIDAHPAILYAWAQAERNADNCKTAITLYRRYLETDPPERGRLLAETNLAACQDQLGADDDGGEQGDDHESTVVPHPRPRPAMSGSEDDVLSSRRAVDPIVVGTMITGSTLSLASIGLFIGARATIAVQNRTEDYARFDVLDRRIRDIHTAAAVTGVASLPLLIAAVVRAVRTKKPTRTTRLHGRPGGILVRF